MNRRAVLLERILDAARLPLRRVQKWRKITAKPGLKGALFE
jgi:hypothetical protein